VKQMGRQIVLHCRWQYRATQETDSVNTQHMPVHHLLETNYDSVVSEFTSATYCTYLSCITSQVLDSLQCWTGINFWTYRCGPDMGLYENFIPSWPWYWVLFKTFIQAW
jgi:hypothetical protein